MMLRIKFFSAAALLVMSVTIPGNEGWEMCAFSSNSPVVATSNHLDQLWRHLICNRYFISKTESSPVPEEPEEIGLASPSIQNDRDEKDRKEQEMNERLKLLLAGGRKPFRLISPILNKNPSKKYYWKKNYRY